MTQQPNIRRCEKIAEVVMRMRKAGVSDEYRHMVLNLDVADDQLPADEHVRTARREIRRLHQQYPH